ncbi:hypothetical protein BDY24DRAFT_372325 [Mrakia frigida]|uniref:uncharacterized protein n=1 Tax=Mrakia frigida TaxID=29902 RepID=UPI003FCBFC01
MLDTLRGLKRKGKIGFLAFAQPPLSTLHLTLCLLNLSGIETWLSSFPPNQLSRSFKSTLHATLRTFVSRESSFGRALPLPFFLMLSLEDLFSAFGRSSRRRPPPSPDLPLSVPRLRLSSTVAAFAYEGEL